MSLGMRWIISEASTEWQQRRMYFVELHSSIVNRGEWLGRAARLFEVGYCSPFWVVT